MDTVSYLTVNDETKEIADILSRNKIQNVVAAVATNSNDIEFIQFETGPNGSIHSAIDRIETMADEAQTSATAASSAATIADNKATFAGEAAISAQTSANSASNAAVSAWNKANEANSAAELANTQANSAMHAVNAAWSHADSASNAASLAWTRANEATNAATLADQKADLASTAAGIAQTNAARANNYANGALNGLSTLESVIDTVNWFADHRIATTDTTVNINKNYYTYDVLTGTMSIVDPSGLENPSQEGWYELDETIQNYVVSHVATTDDGLYVASVINGWRILVSTGTGNYTPGVFIVDPNGVIKQAMTGTGINFDNTVPFTIGDNNASIVFDGNGHITLSGSGININSGVKIGQNNKTFEELLEDAGASIKTIEYGTGNSSSSHSDIDNWSSSAPVWEPNKYVWMRTTTNGLTYTYTCIQGAQGPAGETGAQGATGEAGNEGVGVESVEISYATSNTNYTMPDDEDWVDEIDIKNPPAQGTWLWTRVVTTYTDDTSSATYQQSYIGTDGENGQNAIRVEIDPIGGNFIKRGQVGTSLVAHVYEGINDITNQFSHFTWYRRKADGTRDTSWSTQETSNQLSITTADIDESAVFVCEVTVTR